MFSQASVILFTEGGGGLCPSMHHRSHDQGGLCPGGSLSKGVSVQGVLYLGGLCPGESLSGGSLLGTPPVRRVGGTHPTGMHSCFKCKYTLLLMAIFRIHL